MKLAVLISGRGSNLQALIDACAKDEFPAEIALVLSNKADAQGLHRAAQGGIATAVLKHTDYANREAFDRAMSERLEEAGVDLICLAGFMRLLSDGFVKRWRDKVINIHPSLLPAFKGLHVHERAVEAGVRFSGCTVHVVRPAMDEGPIIAQAVVPVLQNDTADDLAARILIQEHRIYPMAVRLIAEGRLRIGAERAIVDAPEPKAEAMINPCEKTTR
ncbi:phosphoribosylglycinamide formyltransferase [Varunaivibrio sulfuroxidans]|uniref:Phosphoribosylglycinamide formyltransferase n=1 Tax=Varunaivibrio sulfuroxidans TaxID=1773489 RepID=A0A4R3J4Z5_9PROT|nr:formyltetrahydrofolate-dependent phosphoribosylglycinamide formyltransferase [Varunaivibrio sulfuroxidans]